MSTMNKSQFLREVKITMANDLAMDPISAELDKEQKDRLVAESVEYLADIFDILMKDGYYIGRTGKKY